MTSMRLIAFATLLALHTTLGATQSQDHCKDLLKPLTLDPNSPIFGKWVLNVAASDQPGLTNEFSILKSSWIDMVQSAGRVLAIHYADRLKEENKEEQCVQGVAQGSFCESSTHSTFIINGETSVHESKYYETCADCMLSVSTSVLPDGTPKKRYMFLWTRTGQLDASQVEKFKQQAQCLNMHPEYHIGGVSDLCPDQREA